jgi:hypothetical protein
VSATIPYWFHTAKAITTILKNEHIWDRANIEPYLALFNQSSSDHFPVSILIENSQNSNIVSMLVQGIARCAQFSRILLACGARDRFVEFYATFPHILAISRH